MNKMDFQSRRLGIC